jgi:oligoendopeptidase F
MGETLKERKDIDPRYQWDLTEMYKSDEEWEEELKEIDAMIEKAGSFAGTLHDAEHILAGFRFRISSSTHQLKKELIIVRL